MSSNPYQPPESHDTRISRTLPRDLGPITLATSVVFSLQAAVILSMSVTEVMVARRTGGRAPSPEEALTAPDVLYGLSALGFLVLLIPGIVLFCLWIRGAKINADALVSTGTEFTPGWAVGWFFVPFANLFKPYQVVAEIYRASDPKADPDYWSLGEVPRYLMLWWLSYLGFNYVSNRNGLFPGSAQLQLGGWSAMVQGVLGMVAAAMVVVITRSIHRLQREKARRTDAGELPSLRPQSSAQSPLGRLH